MSPTPHAHRRATTITQRASTWPAGKSPPLILYVLFMFNLYHLSFILYYRFTDVLFKPRGARMSIDIQPCTTRVASPGMYVHHDVPSKTRARAKVGHMPRRRREITGDAEHLSRFAAATPTPMRLMTMRSAEAMRCRRRPRKAAHALDDEGEADAPADGRWPKAADISLARH